MERLLESRGMIAITACITMAVAGRLPPPRTLPQELDPGVTLRVFWVETDLQAIATLTPDQTPNSDVLRPTIDFGQNDFGDVPSPFVTLVSGWLVIEQPGQYAFRLTSDDGSRLTIDDAVIINHDGRHGATAKTSGDIQLTAGMHLLLIEHFDHAGKRQLRLEWKSAATPEFQLIPTGNLRAERDLTRVTSPGFKQLANERRPGDGKPVVGVHPAWTVTTIRPDWFQPLIGAMTFASDGRLIVGTFNPLQRDDRTLPDIDSKPPDKLYGLSGVAGDDPSAVVVEVVADGLYEPCGLCAVGDDLYVSQRKAITKLSDLNHDGFYETHETVAEGWEGWNYHQFCFGLVHRDGRLYATLSTAMAPPAWEGMGTNAAPNGPMRGCVLEVDLSSKSVSVVAGGLRAPNGIGLGPDDSLWYLDNQGAWMPTSQLCEVIPGRFYGHHNRTNFVPNLAERFPQGGHPSAFVDRPRTPASVLLPHNELSNSPTQPQFIKEGMFAGQMYIGELTGGGIRRVYLERINGQWQGAVFHFTQGLECGVNRLIWGPDGSLYAGGIGAGGDWNWRGTRFGLQRLSPSGKTAFEILAVRARPHGFEVEFTKPVNREWLANAANFTAEQWRYEPTAAYGGPKVDQESLTVVSANPSQDGRRVTLHVDGLKSGHCVHLRMDPVSNGEPIWSTDAWYTLNEIPLDAATNATIGGAKIDPWSDGVGVGVLPPADSVPLLSASADPVFRKGDAAQLPSDGGRSAEELAALPGWVEIGKGTGDLTTSTVFGDCRLHVEWLAPPGGEGQMAGNSGVYLQNLYEIQVLGTKPADSIAKDEAGAIYSVKAADINASTGPGTWQSYDIWFRAPRFSDGTKTSDARLTMYWNGVLVHDDVAIAEPTGAAKSRGEIGGGPIQVGPLRLQDHPSDADGPVRFRNIWIAPLDESKYVAGEWHNLFGDVGADGLPKGWVVRGGDATFRMERGELIGTSKPNTPNTFLMTERDFTDFELLLEFRQDPRLNSGVQIRSSVFGGLDNREGGMIGPQVELDPGERGYTGGIYDERRRGWLYRLIDAPYARRAYRPNAWNQLRIVATGPVIRTWINSVPAANLSDEMDRRGGRIGLQVHGMGDNAEEMEVRWRNVRIREMRSD